MTIKLNRNLEKWRKNKRQRNKDATATQLWGKKKYEYTDVSACVCDAYFSALLQLRLLKMLVQLCLLKLSRYKLSVKKETMVNRLIGCLWNTLAYGVWKLQTWTQFLPYFFPSIFISLLLYIFIYLFSGTMQLYT